MVLSRQPTEKVAPERANRLSYEARRLPPRIHQSPPPQGISGTRQRKSPHFRAGLDLLTEEAVSGEPVSDANSLHQGIYQGDSRGCARPHARMFLIRRGLRGVHEALRGGNQGIVFGSSRESFRRISEHPRTPAVADPRTVMRARTSVRAPVMPSDVHQFSQRRAGSNSWQIARSALPETISCWGFAPCATAC